MRTMTPNSNHEAEPKSSRGASLLSDDEQLQRLGKRPLLNRSFGFMSMLGFSCSALLSWEGVLITMTPGLLNGGPAGVVWGFLINWIGTMSVYAAMAELASMAPTAGGQCKCDFSRRLWDTHGIFQQGMETNHLSSRSLGCHDGAEVVRHISRVLDSMVHHHGLAGYGRLDGVSDRDSDAGHHRTWSP